MFLFLLLWGGYCGGIRVMNRSGLEVFWIVGFCGRVLRRRRRNNRSGTCGSLCGRCCRRVFCRAEFCRTFFPSRRLYNFLFVFLVFFLCILLTIVLYYWYWRGFVIEKVWWMFVISFNFIKLFIYNMPGMLGYLSSLFSDKLPCCLKIGFPVSLYLSVTAP